MDANHSIKRFTLPGCLTWCQRQGVTIRGDRVQFCRKKTHRIDGEIPQDSRSLAFLASEIAKLFAPSNHVLVWLTEWGIWPSEESWPLFRRWLLSHGDTRSLGEAPGFLFE